MIPNPPDFDRFAGPEAQCAQVADAVRERLAPVTPDLDRELQRVLGHTYPATLWQVDFEIHGVFELDREVDITVHFYAAGYKELLAELPLTDALLIELPPALTEGMFRSWGMEPRSDKSDWVSYVAELAVIGWFADRWQSVAAGRFSHRATVAAHDAEYRFDLTALEWSDSL